MITNKSSRLFHPLLALQKNAVPLNNEFISKSSQLMLNNGIIKQSSPGTFHFLPIGSRVLDKLTNIIDTELKKEEAQKVLLPTLTPAKLWKASGRYKDVANELFKLKDRHDYEYIISPTQEEAAADLITSLGLVSYKRYPIKFYQITSKFRDEMKPRFGLMRARQFIMKDLYSFDIDVENAKKTYHKMCDCYSRIFNTLSLDWVKVLGSPGTMGGDLSHEYHLPAELGEDKLLLCLECKFSANLEYLQSGSSNKQSDAVDINKCPSCKSSNIKITNGIEVGHTFFLGDKYTKTLNTKYLAEDGKPKVLQMGSYGLGVSRIIAAAVEILSEEAAIRWPSVLCPFKAVIIGPKAGSKEEKSLSISPETVYHHLNNCSLMNDNVLFDDRSEMTIGKRLLEAKRTGYPFVIILGEKASQNHPLLEVVSLYEQQQYYMSVDQLIDFFVSNNSESMKTSTLNR